MQAATKGSVSGIACNTREEMEKHRHTLRAKRKQSTRKELMAGTLGKERMAESRR